MKRVQEKAHRLAAAEEPQLRPIKGGWAASGDGWAVHGASREEAIGRFRTAVRQHQQIAARPYWYEVLQSLMATVSSAHEHAFS